MCRVFTTFILVIFLLNNTLFSAPNDFNGDGISDPSAVLNQSPLEWRSLVNGQEQTPASNFGVLGNNLAVGDYTGSGVSEPAHVNSNANWFILVDGKKTKLNFGADQATYMAGADVDGDGKDDLMYHDNRCRKKKTLVHALPDPLNGTAAEVQVLGGPGYFYTTYMDANGDGTDDFCWAAARKKGARWTKRFKLNCKDLVTGVKVARFSIGSVYQRPEPLKVPGANDMLVLHRKQKGKTKVRLVNTKGKTKARVTFAAAGILVVGNYTNSDQGMQQVAVVNGTEMQVYDHDTRSLATIDAPDGIAFDEVNINHFDTELDACICTTKTIQSKGRCKARKANGCAEQRALSDGGGNWLHKPASDNTGHIVNLFNPSDNPSNCRYENQQGELVSEAFFSGNSNPNRPTWRPLQGNSCKDFPKNLVVTCTVRKEKHCWTIPDPCQRYD